MTRTNHKTAILATLLLLGHVFLGPGPSAARAQTSETPNCLPASPSGPSASPTAPDSSTPYDLVILDSMLNHSIGALTLANLALQETSDARIWRIALRIAESRATEIHLLRSWRQAWYPQAAPWPSPATPSSMVATATSCPAGEFDRQFLQQLLTNRLAVIELATASQTQVEHPELRNFMASTAETQSNEITAIQSLLSTLSTPSTGHHSPGHR